MFSGYIKLEILLTEIEIVVDAEDIERNNQPHTLVVTTYIRLVLEIVVCVILFYIPHNHHIVKLILVISDNFEMDSKILQLI